MTVTGYSAKYHETGADLEIRLSCRRREVPRALKQCQPGQETATIALLWLKNLPVAEQIALLTEATAERLQGQQ